MCHGSNESAKLFVDCWKHWIQHELDSGLKCWRVSFRSESESHDSSRYRSVRGCDISECEYENLFCPRSVLKTMC